MLRKILIVPRLKWLKSGAASPLELFQALLDERVLLIKKTFGYKQRDEKKRKEFIDKIETYDDSQIIYLDESGIRNNEAIEYGWALKGQKLYDLKNGSRNKSFNIIAALKNGELIAPFAFEGACNSDIFNTYLRKILKPLLTKGSVIVLDNASFHKFSDMKKIAEKSGCIVEFLPPYSPDLNDIEGYWHSVKSRFRRIIKNTGKSPIDAITEVFMSIN